MFDNVTGNNTASDTSTDATLTAGNYAFTLGACTAGVAIGAPGSNCTRFVGPYTAGTDQQLYITNLNNGIPTQVKNGDTNVKMQFSLSCINPGQTAGVAPAFAGQTLKPCYPNGVVPPAPNNTYWAPSTAMNIFFPGKQASGKLSATSVPVFTYFDVGLVQLNLYDTAGKTTASSARFVSAPQSLRFGTIQNLDNGFNPAGNSAFAMAGEPFSVGVVGMTAPNGSTPASAAPNFGNEAGPFGPARPKLTLPDGTSIPVTPGVSGGGVVAGNVTWDAVGNVALVASGLIGQDNSSGYFGAPVAAAPGTATVGYFYPAYFQTVASGLMTCLTPMACPTGTTANGDERTAAGAAYSSQSFPINVKAFTANGTEVTTNVASLPAFQIALDPYSSPGAAGVAMAKPADFAGIVDNSVASTVSNLVAKPTISLNIPFSSGAPRAAWQAPISVYMRASASFIRPAKASDGTQTTKKYTIISNRGNGVKSVEAGVRIVHGRLLVANGFGSELIKLPLHVYAQYWTGTSWNNNPNDSDSPITFSNPGAFSNCVKNLDAGSGTCRSVVSFLSQGGSINLDNGQGIIWMQAPGVGYLGKADVVIMPSAPWLPSTRGQAVFGAYKSPLIYIREVY
jgi:hypothetical protein